MSQEYIDRDTGLAFLSLDGQLPPGARPVKTVANAPDLQEPGLGGEGSAERPAEVSAASSPANARGTYGPAGPATDADEVYQSYSALPLSERLRFWLYLNDGEQSFTLETLRELKKRLDRARVDKSDRSEFDRLYEPLRDTLGLLGANGHLSTTNDRDGEREAVSAGSQVGARGAAAPAGRGKILGARVRR